MPAQAICCASCSWPLGAEWWNRGAAVRCPSCGFPTMAAVFPAAARVPTGAQPQTVDAEGEASCFFHPANRAEIPCDRCGRFLCHLCDLEVEGKHWCSSCLTAGVVAREGTTLEPRRMMYDSIALALVTLPVLLLPALILTASMALVLVFRHWRSVRSVVPRSRLRLILAGLLAVVDIGLLGILFWWISMTTRGRL